MRRMILTLALVLASGCGASAYRQHATAIVAVSAVHEITVETFDAARHVAFVEARDAHPAGERNAALDAEANRWRPAAAGLDTVRRTLTTWAEALDAARRADAGDELFAALVPVVARLIQLYDDTARMLRALGVAAPELPALVLGLANGSVGR